MLHYDSYCIENSNSEQINTDIYWRSMFLDFLHVMSSLIWEAWYVIYKALECHLLYRVHSDTNMVICANW